MSSVYLHHETLSLLKCFFCSVAIIIVWDESTRVRVSCVTCDVCDVIIAERDDSSR